MKFELFPQSVTLYPDDQQTFQARATSPPPMWSEITSGFVLPDYSLQLGFSSLTFVEGSGALQLAEGIGAIEWTMTASCLPTSTGSLKWSVFISGGAYKVIIKTTTIEIRDIADSLVTTLNISAVVGTKFKIEIFNGFRLYVDGVLQNSLTSFGGSIAYPATYTARLTLPVSVAPATIPAPALLGKWQLRPVVTFKGNIIGNLSSPGPGLTTKYFNATVPGTDRVTGVIHPGDQIYMEDSIPTGGVQNTGGGDFWTFVGSNPTPFSGTLCHKSQNIAGSHSHGFTAATETLQINPGDILYCYVFVDAVNPPTEIMIGWNASDSTTFHHIAYWGPDLITVVPERKAIGAVPVPGVWVRLEVPADLVDLEGRIVNGMSFILFDGVCSFDQAGRYPGIQRAESVITIPPLRILSEWSITAQPSEIIRLRTNYQDAQSLDLVTWSILTGGGSITADGVFTAPAYPGTIIVRAAYGNQVADVMITVPVIITPSFGFAGPLEQIDFNTNLLDEPFFVSAGATAEGTGNVTPGLPPGLAERDIMLLIAESANESVPTPAGWGIAGSSPQGTGTGGGAAATRLSAFWKRAGLSEVPPLVTDPGDHIVAKIHAYRGCISSGNPWDVTQGDVAAAATTAVSIPGATTTVNKCLIVQAVAHATDTAVAQASGYANGALTSLTERSNVSSTQGNGGGFAVIDGKKAVAGAFGATTATLATSSVQGRITIALKPNFIAWSSVPAGVNASTGVWTLPGDLERKVRVSVSDGLLAAQRDLLILPKFPPVDFVLPISWDRNLSALVSMSEDRTSRITREKAPAYDSYPVKLQSITLADCNAIDAFFDQQGLGKLFILEDKVRGIRKVGWFDSPIRHEARDECDIDLAFQFLEARI